MKLKKNILEEDSQFNLEEQPYIELNIAERNSLFSLAGYLISKINNTKSVCEECLSSILASQSDSILNKNAQLSLEKANDINKFFFVKDNVFDFFYEMEVTCRNVTQNFSSVQQNISEKCVKELEKIIHSFDESCDKHDKISNVIIKKFVLLRLKISKQKKGSLQTFNYDSYSLR